MKDELKRHRDRLSEKEAQYVWRGIRARVFRTRRSWKPVWAIGIPVAVAAAALLIFVIGRGPDLDVIPRDVQVQAPAMKELAAPKEGPTATTMLMKEKGAGTEGIVLDKVQVEGKRDVIDAAGEPTSTRALEEPAAEPSGAGRLDLVREEVPAEPPMEVMRPRVKPEGTEAEVIPEPKNMSVLERGAQVEKKDLKVRAIDTVEEAISTTAGLHHQGVSVRGGRSSKVMYGTDGAKAMSPPPAGDNGYHRMAHGGVVPPNGEPVDAMFFEHYGVNPFIASEDDNLSTFAIDVDTGSYTVCRGYLNGGYLPPKEAVRVEEFINFFPHEYEPPRKGDFSIHLEAAPSEFGEDLVLFRVGLQGRVVAERDRKPSNLVFVIDTSGSMQREDRLGLVKRALTRLLDEMDRRDRVGIVEYGSTGRVVLRPTSVKYREEIIDAIENLRAHGSTFAEQGLRLGYEMADRNYDSDYNNRVILCSDGVANVGRTGAEGILDTMKNAARRGIYLTVVGFGMGNYNDILMEKLADHGDGHYCYVDDMKEARRVFTENLTGTLQTIARDVKVQVEFNLQAVKRYRLIGYENRDVADKDFRNDKVDAGEIGSGHKVTALYELRLHDDADEKKLATVHLRWENPETGKVTEIKERFDGSDVRRRFEHASWSFQRDGAVAEFAEILRHSYWARDGHLRDVEDLLDRLAGDRKADRETLELLDLVKEARREWKDEIFGNEWRDERDEDW
ncbi:MAG: von Willebrand factor type A domain-containing protein [Candidatus Eisenbacteria sp.]|nr:von Willebrand factor type A domain-containing protein [Candidatus Eisenbacteria bacterium]